MVVRTPSREPGNPRGAVRVAVVTLDSAARSAESRILPGLRQIDLPLDVQEFDDLYDEAPGLADFGPRLLILDLTPDVAGFPQILGAVRILRSLLPSLQCVVVHDDPMTPENRAACADQEMSLLSWPHTVSELQHVVSEAVTGSVGAEGYLQFVQGICDEINNPLMFATGHLQLLVSRLDPERDEETLAQVSAVKQGLSRIQATMQKVGIMGRASRLQRQDKSFDVGELIDAASTRADVARLDARLRCPDDCRSTRLRGDVDILSGALFGLCEVGRELTPADGVVELEVTEAAEAIEMRMRIRDPRLEEWQLPRAFEPYHLNTVLRGTPAGLNLFLLRLVTRAHGWEAFVHRTGDGVEFCISAPRPRNGTPPPGPPTPAEPR